MIAARGCGGGVHPFSQAVDEGVQHSPSVALALGMAQEAIDRKALHGASLGMFRLKSIMVSCAPHYGSHLVPRSSCWRGRSVRPHAT